MSQEDKVQFKVYITRKTRDSFRQFLSQKWQTYGHGLLSSEVEQAIKQYISGGDVIPSPTHTHTNSTENDISTSHRSKKVKVEEDILSSWRKKRCQNNTGS